MRKLLISAMFGLLAMSATAPAQTLGGSAWYDFQSRQFTPVVTTRITELPDFLGVKGFRPELRAFAGIQNARGLAGTALVASGPLAKNATWDFGIGARAATGRKVGLGVIAGVSIKFWTAR